MSLIEKKNLNYFTVVERFFLSLKDSGLSLSASDYHLIDRWEKRGVAAAALCRAIELGVERARERARSPRMSLAYLKPFIEEELERVNP